MFLIWLLIVWLRGCVGSTGWLVVCFAGCFGVVCYWFRRLRLRIVMYLAICACCVVWAVIAVSCVLLTVVGDFWWLFCFRFSDWVGCLIE